jgi:hypothetical protein
MVRDNQENTGFSDSLGEHDYSTKFTLIGRSQSKYVENPGVASGNIEAIEIAAMSIPGAVADLGTDAANKALAGFDTIFSPYTNASGHAELPHFEIPTNLTEPNSYTLDPFNPNNIFDTGNSQALNNAIYQSSGHNIQIANTWSNDDISGATSGDIFFAKDLYNHGEFTFDGVKSLGLRSPMVLTGWGFDVDDNPVPADASDNTAFASGAFRNPNIWKSGPLDVRWDDERKVWAAGAGATKIYLVKTTNSYNPSCFSYEVQRSDSRAQYTRDTLSRKAFSATDPIHDPEYLAYTADSDNKGCFERLDFDGQEYPHYEAFIIRETKDSTDSNPYYNIWTDDCHDCGHITNSGCGTQHASDSTGKKILIENPLRQSLNVGDLAFTVKTGRKEKVNSGSFSGGTGTGASGNLVTDSDGNISGDITAAGAGYQYGGFAIITGDICTNVSLTFGGEELTAITVSPTGGFDASTTYPLTIYPNDTAADTEELDVHWILQAEFKSQQVTTHVECNGGILQTCTTKIQTQGFKSCEWCGEDLTLVNNFI